jgi:hypothetical protein
MLWSIKYVTGFNFFISVYTHTLAKDRLHVEYIHYFARENGKVEARMSFSQTLHFSVISSQMLFYFSVV